MYRMCRKVSQSDMAHVKGFYGGNIFYRDAQDANRHCTPLVGGYIIGNESEKAHQICNQFTLSVFPAFDLRETEQVDVLDGDKGGSAAFANVFMNALGFMCKNHRKINVMKGGNKDPCAEYLEAEF